MNNFKISWRNVWRNKRRTLVTIAAMSLALLSMIVYSGLIEGYLAIMERNVLDLELGDIQAFADGYLDNRSIHRTVDGQQEVVESLNAAGLPATARLLAAGLAAAGDSSAGVLLKGIHIKNDARVSSVHQHIREGRWLDISDPGGVVIGHKLARLLGVQPGAEIVVLTQGADGSMANDLYHVRGILKGISNAVDRGGIFMLESDFRDLMVIPTGAHQIIVRKPAVLDLDAAAATARKLAPELEVQTWREMMPTLASMLDSTRGVMYTMFMIVYFAIGIVILNAMLMAVFERIREFGILKAIGMAPSTVWNLIVLESTIKTTLAVAAGTLLSLPVLWYLSAVGINLGAIGGISVLGIAWDPIWRATITADTFVGPIVVLVVVVSFAVFYPALKAAFIRPVKAIYHR